MFGAACGSGSPARAGIDPICSTAPATSIRFPRTRGDRPLECLFDLVAEMGSPARAGIDPAGETWNPIRARFPRTRGDRPVCTRSRVKLDGLWPDNHIRGSDRPIIPDAPARGRSLIAIRSVVMSFCHSQQFGRTLARAGNIHFELAADTRNRGKATLERPPQSGSVISVRRQARIAPDASSTGRPGTAGRKFGSGRLAARE